MCLSSASDSYQQANELKGNDGAASILTWDGMMSWAQAVARRASREARVEVSRNCL